jgi:hypothetical protein
MKSAVRCAIVLVLAECGSPASVCQSTRCPLGGMSYQSCTQSSGSTDFRFGSSTCTCAADDTAGCARCAQEVASYCGAPGGGSGSDGGVATGAIADGGAADMGPLPLGIRNKVDVLFMIDNSPSMAAMQTELRQHFAAFFSPLVPTAGSGKLLDLHIGVVTSDYGAGAVANVAGGCDASPGGQKGFLQQVGAAGAGCVGPQGVPFIQYAVDATGGVTANLPGGATDHAALAAAFSCMASVGSNGCGFEHQLESVYAALHNGSENAGFLRPDALLVVVFLTNEDDGSAPPTTDVFNPDPAKVGQYGAYDTYRQTRFGVACGSPLMLSPEAASGGPLAGCQAAPNDNAVQLGAEYDVSRYTQFFTQPKAQGGVKDDPLNVVLVAIDGPESPVSIRTVVPGSGNGTVPNPSYVDCPTPSTTCLVRVDHSCQNQVQPAFFADPAVRLNSVVNAVGQHQVSSVCGASLTATPDFSSALSQAAALIKARLL